MEEKKYYDLKEAAEQSGHSVTYLRHLCATRRVEHLRRGAKYYFTPEQIEKLFVRVEPIEVKQDQTENE